MRLIDADALVEAVKDYPYGFRGMIVCDIAQQPTIDPVRHGEWAASSYGYFCTACKNKKPKMWGEPRYCPNCGARMDEE